VIVNLHLLQTVIKIAGIIWQASHDETGQSRFFQHLPGKKNATRAKLNWAQ